MATPHPALDDAQGVADRLEAAVAALPVQQRVEAQGRINAYYSAAGAKHKARRKLEQWSREEQREQNRWLRKYGIVVVLAVAAAQYAFVASQRLFEVMLVIFLFIVYAIYSLGKQGQSESIQLRKELARNRIELYEYEVDKLGLPFLYHENDYWAIIDRESDGQAETTAADELVRLRFDNELRRAVLGAYGVTVEGDDGTDTLLMVGPD